MSRDSRSITAAPMTPNHSVATDAGARHHHYRRLSNNGWIRPPILVIATIRTGSRTIWIIAIPVRPISLMKAPPQMLFLVKLSVIRFLRC